MLQAKPKNEVFDYRALRFLMGLVAFSLPAIVTLLSANCLTSISVSYYSCARDSLVGMLFVVGSFLFAYNGHTCAEAMASKVASVAAICVALFPTNCVGCPSSCISYIHYLAAASLFSILAYFCFVPFQRNTRGFGGKKERRSRIYRACGWIMIICMAMIVLSKIFLPAETIAQLRIVYWGETGALMAFGFGWIISGKVLKPFVDEHERFSFF